MHSGMHPADIQCLLKKRGITQKQIADELGIHPISVSREVHGKPISEEIRQAIAKKIERDPKEVFAGYYFRPKKKRRPTGRFKTLTLERVEDALARTDGKKPEAARLLGVCRATLYNFLAENKTAA